MHDAKTHSARGSKCNNKMGCPESDPNQLLFFIDRIDPNLE